MTPPIPEPRGDSAPHLTAPTPPLPNSQAPPSSPQGFVAPPPSAAGQDGYNFVADKIGFVPNVRKSDNVLQAKVFLGVWIACILLGALLGRGDGALLGGLFGLIVALLVSGTVLAVVGLKRRS